MFDLREQRLLVRFYHVEGERTRWQEDERQRKGAQKGAQEKCF